ncbi:hypothetical protein A9Q02_20030 [Candidatus Chloroploca asiatica]|uniref:Uncharacterized protein n=1 Tax=Candidatus Chloroploca asiatica TaxID=1506545 RepID=A0A2H3L3R7_9CHLR|nr:hypothetical protein A9Q02_20030 [Candidatus Chloroploca asiatica]
MLVAIVAQLRLDAALYDPVPPPVPEQRGDYDHHQQAQSVHEDVPLALVDVFAFVMPAHTGNLRGFAALTVETIRCGMFLASRLLAYPCGQVVLDALPRAIIAPDADIIVDRFPLRIVLGQHAPLDTTDDRQDGLDDQPHVDAPRTATALGRRDQILDTIPLVVGQVSWVGLVLYPPSVPKPGRTTAIFFRQRLKAALVL